MVNYLNKPTFCDTLKIILMKQKSQKSLPRSRQGGVPLPRSRWGGGYPFPGQRREYAPSLTWERISPSLTLEGGTPTWEGVPPA